MVRQVHEPLEPSGSVTVTVRVPVGAESDTVTVVVSRLVVTNEVGPAVTPVPEMDTTELETNPAPFTVRVWLVAPRGNEFGLTPEIRTTGSRSRAETWLWESTDVYSRIRATAPAESSAPSSLKSRSVLFPSIRPTCELESARNRSGAVSASGPSGKSCRTPFTYSRTCCEPSRVTTTT